MGGENYGDEGFGLRDPGLGWDLVSTLGYTCVPLKILAIGKLHWDYGVSCKALLARLSGWSGTSAIDPPRGSRRHSFENASPEPL